MDLPQTPSFKLNGKTALVTGASSGIGLGAACALAQAGAQVVMLARSEVPLTQAAALLCEQGFDAKAVPLDVCNKNAVQAAIEKLDSLHILVNNAGTNRPGPMLQASEEDYNTVMDVNVRAAYFVAQAAVAKIKQSGKGGVVINTSSQMGHVGGLDRSIYCASKFAIEGLSKAMAIEFASDNIRVNTICPTFIATPFTQATLADPEKVVWIQSKIKLGRYGTVEDLMGAFVFLSSDAASLITGASLLVDGGWTAG